MRSDVHAECGGRFMNLYSLGAAFDLSGMNSRFSIPHGMLAVPIGVSLELWVQNERPVLSNSSLSSGRPRLSSWSLAVSAGLRSGGMTPLAAD